MGENTAQGGEEAGVVTEPNTDELKSETEAI